MSEKEKNQEQETPVNETPSTETTPPQETDAKAPETVEEKAAEAKEVKEEKPEKEAEVTAEAEKTEETKEEKPEKEAEVTAEAEKKEEPKAEEKKIEKAEATPKSKKTIVPPEINWDTIGKRQDNYSSDERQKLEDLYDNSMKSIAEHEVIDGTVIGLTDREVVVNIGYKSEGVISRSEVRYNPELKVGDPIEVYVEVQEDSKGQLVLSHRKARILKSWERVNAAHDKDEIIKGHVKSRTKGGLIVDVFGIEAFLPGSQIDVKPIRDYDAYVDKIMEFKVVKINHEFKNVVVSHKALIEDELEAQKSEIIAKLEKGQVLEGIVKNITSYGVFIDLGGVDGLIHITDLSWGRINHPEEVVELDEKIKVVILDFDDSKKRIALGLKQLQPHPWDSLDESLKIGSSVKGKVVVVADYGAFIEINPGVEGLIHVSEMSWSQHLRTAQDFLSVGDEVEAVILTLDREERKMSLGMKQLIPDPWANIKSRYPQNSKHTATVRNFTNFGIFVELEEGVDGLIHISDLSWSKKIKHPAEFTKIGEKLEVVVLDVDEENRRLSLGHKQLEENPWDVFETVFTETSIHKGTILEISDKGATVALPYGVEGFAPKRHLKKEDDSPVKVDENMEFKVIEFSKENKKIILSHIQVYKDKEMEVKAAEKTAAEGERKQTRKKIQQVNEKIEKTTLGDISALADLKSDMEKEAKEKLEKMAKTKKGGTTKAKKEKEEKQEKDEDKAAE